MTFRAPVREIAFSLAAAGHGDLIKTAFPDLDEETVGAVLRAAGDFAEAVLAPLNRTGDTVGARYENGRVTCAPGFADAYRQFIEGGWTSLAADPEYGGQGLPKALELGVFQMAQTANLSFSLCPILSQGAIEALSLVGSERQKQLYLPKLVSGEWAGTMNLTEPQAGSDLAALTTRAEPDGAGGYRLFGQKIFISWGDHDAAENILHLVLARLPDAPPGVKGISLFLASKRRLAADATPGGLNDLRPAGIEKKLGLHASPTCVMAFDGAEAELVGTANEGLAHMFVMMNAARLQVGLQGVAIAERAYQQALDYSQERRQGRSVWSGDYPAAIWNHPDVRRTLAVCKAKTAAARGICLMTAVLADLARLAPDPDARAAAKARQDLLTPIAKAWSTDVGVEVTSAALQVHGGMGYIEETGAAQHFRDARILPIYEGTNAIQAIDLVGRKLTMGDGAVLRGLLAEVTTTAEALSATEGLDGVGRRLAQGVLALERASDWLLANRGVPALAGATAYLDLAGIVIGGWVLGREALLAAGADDPWLQGRQALARIYADQVLTQADGRAAAAMVGEADLAALTPEALGA
ncbi:MAG: acyl-CoA dehydrogenase [Phenylobacterium sp.]